jgi:hypothetical protein
MRRPLSGIYLSEGGVPDSVGEADWGCAGCFSVERTADPWAVEEGRRKQFWPAHSDDIAEHGDPRRTAISVRDIYHRQPS